MMDRTKEAINKMRKEYQKRIGELLTEEYEFNEGSIDTVSALSNTHSLEAGIHTLNTLEKILDGDEKTIKKWGLKNLKKNDTPCRDAVKDFIEYFEIQDNGVISLYTLSNEKVFISNTLLNYLINAFDEKGLLNNNKPYPVARDYHIEDDGTIIIDTTQNTFHIPPRKFNEIVKGAIDEKYLKISLLFVRNSKGDWVNKCDIKMKPKTEEEED